jgi:hypothetical protein
MTAARLRDFAVVIKNAGTGPAFDPAAAVAGKAGCAICPRIVFIALLSIWRMRSADTPYSSASSCSVDVESSSRSQRASMMRRLRSSSFASAVLRPAVRFRAFCFASRILDGSSSLSVR